MDSIVLEDDEQRRLAERLAELAVAFPITSPSSSVINRTQVAIAACGKIDDLPTALPTLLEFFANLAEHQFSSLVTLSEVNGFEEDLNLAVQIATLILSRHLGKVFFWILDMQEPLFRGKTGYSDEEIRLWKRLKENQKEVIKLAIEISKGELGTLCRSYIVGYAPVYLCEEERRNFLRSRQIVIEDGESRMFQELWSTFRQLLLIIQLFLPKPGE
jgi:hypothetical protein